MEPRSCERGNIIDGKRKGMNCGLQWSEVPANVENISAPAIGRIVGPLQWGHVSANVETGRDRRHRPHCQLASMEPRSCERGNQVDAVSGAVEALTLQWSHVPANVETTAAMPRQPLARCFNGATFLRTWKR